MADSRFEFRGDLSVTPVADVLSTVHHYDVPGVLTVRRQGIEKRIFLWHGDVIFAASGDRADSLGDWLLNHGKVTPEQFDRSLERFIAAGGAKRHGEVLLEMGILTPGQLFEIVTAQVKGIVLSVFDWDEGEVSFHVGQHKTEEPIQLNIPARHAVLEGVKSMRDAKRCVSFLGPSWTVLEPVDGIGDLSDLGLEPGEERLLKHVNGARTLRDLISLGPGDPAHNARLIYAFRVLKLIAKRESGTRTAIKKIQWRTGGGGYVSG